jgi:hypothetical protein
MNARRQFLQSAYAFLFAAACEPEKLFGPHCGVPAQSPTLPVPERPLRDVYVVDDYSGVQLGTKSNPYSVRTSAEFDALMAFLSGDDNLAHHWYGRFGTKGCYRWGGYATRNVGNGWTIDGDAEMAIDPNAIADSAIDGQPLYVIAGTARSVTGITTLGNHSALADRWRARGQSLRTGGVLLYGVASMDRVTFKGFGAIGAETFVAEIVGSGSIADCEFTAHDPSSSNDQVTVFRVIGSENGEASSVIPCLMEGNTTNAPGSKKVQAHSIYQCPGVVRNNKSVGADVFYYADYWDNRDITIEDNEADDSIHGVQLKLSPTPLPIAEKFSHERYTVGPNRFASSGAQVSLDTCGPATSTRFIRDITIDESLSVENFGATGITRGACRRAA